MTPEERISHLESRLTFSEDALEQLSNQVATQQKELEELRLLVRHLNLRLQELQQAGPESAPGEEPPPPHY